MPIALVTGGARGIGRAAVCALAASGFDIALVSLEPQTEVEDLLRDVRTQGRTVAYFSQDVARLDLHAGLVQTVLERLGPIDCLVNNAGVTSLQRGDLLDLAPDSFDRSIDVNLRGTFFLTQAVARAMVRVAVPEASYRSIINVTSANADIVGMERGDYCMSKAALSMMSKLFAARLAPHGIHVFELRPGIIRTAMTAPAQEKYDRLIAAGGVPLGRWGEPDDVGVTIAALAKGSLPFATGEVLNVGGGLHLHRV